MPTVTPTNADDARSCGVESTAHEVVQAVQREHLKVDTVYAMHQGPVKWREVTGLVTAALYGTVPR